MIKLVAGLAAVSVMSAPAAAQGDRPCEELAIELLAGDWEVDDFLVAGEKPYSNHSVTRGEVVGPGQVKFETAPSFYQIVSYRRSGGTVQLVDSEGEPLAPPSEVVIRACMRSADTGTYHWIEEGQTGPQGAWGYRKEYYASPELALVVLQISPPANGRTSEYVTSGSTHMTRRSSDAD